MNFYEFQISYGFESDFEVIRMHNHHLLSLHRRVYLRNHISQESFYYLKMVLSKQSHFIQASENQQNYYSQIDKHQNACIRIHHLVRHTFFTSYSKIILVEQESLLYSEVYHQVIVPSSITDLNQLKNEDLDAMLNSQSCRESFHAVYAISP